MRMELIQPFINAADAVFAESLQAPTKIVDLTMDENIYRRKGVAALIAIKGDIEGRVILDLAPEVAMRVAGHLAGSPMPESEQVVRETVCELANMVIGNSVTLLNDQGFRFKVFPPEIHMSEEGLGGERRYRSDGAVYRDAVRADLSEYCDALFAPAATRAGRCARARLRVPRRSSPPGRVQSSAPCFPFSVHSWWNS